MPLDEQRTPLLNDSRPNLPNGIQHIALSFSGGGFRAAGFSLGCYAYLQAVSPGGAKLSDKVRFVSSASGGSFTSMTIVFGQRRGWTFDACYRKLFKFLEGDNLLQSVVKILETDAIWKHERPYKSRNPINAFAIAYDKFLFDEQSFGLLWKPVSAGGIPEICVGVTDFTHGQQFRFQHDGTTAYTGEVGNLFLKFPKHPASNSGDIGDESWGVLKKIKLGDILASSSCFPGGFEPIIYPNDFAWRTSGSALTMEELRDAIVANDSFVIPNPAHQVIPGEEQYGLMDGGIVDNQGIDAFAHAEERLISRQNREIRKRLKAEREAAVENVVSEEDRERITEIYKAKAKIAEGYGYDLFAVCDVSSNYTESFSYDHPILKNGLLRFSPFHYTLLAAAIFALAVAGIRFGRYPEVSWLAVGATGIPMAVLSLFLIPKFLRWVGSFFRGAEETEPSTARMFQRHFWYFFKLPVAELVVLIESRASSVVHLAVTLFLKKIRQNAYADHLSSGISRQRVKTLIKAAELRGLVSVSDKPGLEKLIENKKSWVQNTINPTVYLLSTRNRDKLRAEMKKDNWTDLTGPISPGRSADQLFAELIPSPLVTATADLAASMPTTLWFDTSHQAQDMRAALIACGQFTMCHALIRFTHRFANTDEQWQALRKQLLADWHRFQNNPYWLYNQTGAGYMASGKPLEGFKTVSKV